MPLTLEQFVVLEDIPSLALFADATLLLMGGIYYWWRYRQAGVVSLDTNFVILSMLLPTGMMFVFAFSPLNADFASGDSHAGYLRYLDRALYINCLGIGCCALGACFGVRTTRPLLPGFAACRRSIENYCLTRAGMKLALVIAFVVLVPSLWVFGSHFGAARSLAMKSPESRPLLNLYNTVISFCIIVCLIWGQAGRSWLATTIGVCMFPLSFLSGARSYSLVILVNLVMFNMWSVRYKRLLPPLCFAGLLYVVGHFLVLIRHGAETTETDGQRMLGSLLFGNNFSDLRDFAWVMSYWDDEWLLGKTYLAGLLSFVPSGLLDFRRTWAMGAFTVRTLGGDPTVHPGLRVTLFGEPYFNFGPIGVAMTGMALGYLLGAVQRAIDATFDAGWDRRHRLVVCAAAFYYFGIAASFVLNGGSFTSYVQIALIACGLVTPQLAGIRHGRLFGGDRFAHRYSPAAHLLRRSA